MNWQDVQRLRKAKQLAEARDAALEVLATDPGDFRTKSQYQWVIFDCIKLIVADMSEAVEKNQPVGVRDVGDLMAWMNEYRELEPRIPDLACSAILGQVAKVGPRLPEFPGIVHWLGLVGLRPEDWQPNEYEGKTLPSLAMKIARALCKWVKAHPEAGEKQTNLALDWAERVRESAKGDDALWLDWDLAILLRQMGNFQRAARILADVIKAKRGEFWVWAEAGRLYQAEQPELALACFCRALECSAEPKFLVRAHANLAKLLAELEEYAQASREVAITIDIRQVEGWPIGRELEELIASPWYDPSPAGAEDATSFYGRHSPAALTLCFDVVEEKAASYLGPLIPHVPKEAPPGRKPRPLSRFAVMDEQGHSVSLVGPGLWNLKHKPGDPVNIVIGRQVGEGPETIVQVAQRPEGRPWDCTKRIQGRLKRNAKGFAFVNNVFVAPHIVESVGPNVADVAAWAIYAKHPTTGEFSWRAIKLSEA